MLILLLFLVLALVMLVVITSAFIGFVLTRVPFVPTTKKDITLIVKKLPITSKDIFYDLGSGDGKVPFLVEKLSGASVTGFELTWWTHILAKIKKPFKHSRANFINRNFFKQDWSNATIIYGYLYPPLMARVEEKFLTECKQGAVLVVRDFSLPSLKPVEVWHTGPQSNKTNTQPFIDTKLNRLKTLLKSFWPPARPQNHEIFIYKK